MIWRRSVPSAVPTNREPCSLRSGFAPAPGLVRMNTIRVPSGEAIGARRARLSVIGAWAAKRSTP